MERNSWVEIPSWNFGGGGSGSMMAAYYLPYKDLGSLFYTARIIIYTDRRIEFDIGKFEIRQSISPENMSDVFIHNGLTEKAIENVFNWSE